MTEVHDGSESTRPASEELPKPESSSGDTSTATETVELPAHQRFGHFRLPPDAHIKGLTTFKASDDTT